MGKFTAIATYNQFEEKYRTGDIDNNSLNFILDTRQLYVKGFFLNSVTYGAENAQAVALTIAGVTKYLSLKDHIHSNYLEKDSNINIGTNKIITGDETNGYKDLLYYNGGNTYVGNDASPIYLVGTSGNIVKNNTSYTLLDTSNFSITDGNASGGQTNNALTFNYGVASKTLSYIRRLNGNNAFDNLISYSLMGTTQVN